MALSLDEALGMSLADEADESIHVDVNTRQITIPESQQLFGVESDADVEVKHIVIDGRYADGNRDLSKLAWRVIYRNANKDTSYYLIPSVVANENSIEMDWLIKRSVVAYKGTVDFILCAFATTSSGEVTPEWNSTLGQGIVLEGLEASAIDINKEVVDELAKILYETIAARDAAAKSAEDAANSATEAKGSADAAGRSATAASKSEKGAAGSARAAKGSADAAAASAKAAAASAKAAASAVGAAFYGVDFSGSTSAGTRTGAAAEFVFTPGTDTSAGQNDFDGVYPWAGMRRCCCTLNADGTVTVNAYKGQPGYIEDGTNGEVLVEVPLFYVSGMLDVNPRVSAVPMPGFRAPKKFQNADGSLKQKCYLPAFPGSIGADGKLHSIAGVVSTGNRTISRFLAAARLWGETYCINTSADFEVLAYLMIVVYGTRSTQEKIRGVSNLYATNVAVTGARTSEAAVTVGKDVLEVGMIISIGTGGENESVAGKRIVTAIEAIEGDTANVKASFTGEAVTTTTDHKIWRIIQSTGTANSVISTCGSPVSNTDGRHSFVFYGVENPLYGNQWRFECDWKLIDGVPYYCDDPTKYQWSSADDYTKLDGLALPNEGWAKNLQADERFPWLQIAKEVGGSSRTYLGDYLWIDKSGTRIAMRGATSRGMDQVGAFAVYLYTDTSMSWFSCSADLSIPG